MLRAALAALLTASASTPGAAIQELVGEGACDDLPGESGQLQGEVEAFYRGRAWELAWFSGSTPTQRALALAELLADAARMGLDPDDYGGRGWPTRLAPVAQDVAALDVALTCATAQFALDVRRGRVNPRRLELEVPFDPEIPPASRLLAELHAAADLRAEVERLEPPFAPFLRTRRALEAYLELSARPDPPPLPAPPRPVKPRGRYEKAHALAARLASLHDLPPGSELGPEGEYGAELAAAVSRFQRRHGLDADGILGPATIRELNVPLSRRALQLELALERWRWLPRRFAAPPLVVNIPSFRLHAADPAHPLSMRVVVGSAVRSRTPVFAGELTSVVFRPAWNVPRSIARVELAARVAKDPSALERAGFEFLDASGHVIVPEESGPARLAADVRAGKVRMRQKPGPGNALGLVKFVLPNAHDVYLHGTPSQALFGATRRDFSHGCIRVEHPVALAAWVLRGEQGWDEARIRRAMAGRETTAVPLARHLPVLVLYATASMNERGEVQFLPDIYGHDAALERELLKRRAAPARQRSSAKGNAAMSASAN